MTNGGVLGDTGEDDGLHLERGEERGQTWEDIGPDHRLMGPPPDLPPPLPVTAPLILNVDQLSWESLEHLIVALAREVEGAVRARLYGRRGQKQHGVDVVGYFADDSLTVYQAKRWERFTADDLSGAVRVYASGLRPFDADRFVVVTTAYTGDTAVENRLHQLRGDYYPLNIDLWGRQQLSDLLFRHRDLVTRFFGHGTAEVFCVGESDCGASNSGDGIGSPIHMFTDPFALEVHRAIDVDNAGDRLPVLPLYVSREHDVRLRKIIAGVVAGQSALAVLVGDSSTGKTRACWEAIQALPSGWNLWYPIAPSPAEALVDGIGSVGPRTVLWLDEITQYLATPGLGERAAAVLRDLLSDPTRGPVLMLGTAWPRDWGVLAVPPESGALDRHREARALLTGHSVSVPRIFDELALLEARRVSCADRRLAEALERARDGRVVQHLSAAFALMERYSTASVAAQAVVHAAMDARRIGCSRELSRTLLESAAVGYLADDDWADLSEDWFDEALAFLARPCRGASSPLGLVRPRPGYAARSESHYRLADYLDQHGRSCRAIVPAPESLWSALPAHAERNDLGQLAWEARNRGLFRHAFQLHLSAVGAGSEDTLWLAGDLMERSERFEEALYWYRRAVEVGDGDAYANAVELFEILGRKDEVITWLRELAEAGDVDALSWAVEFIVDAEGADQALDWLGRFIELGQNAALCEAAEILRQNARHAEALDFYQRAAAAGEKLAIRPAVNMLLEANGAETVLAWLDDLEDLGITDLRVKAAILNKAERTAESLACYKQAAAAGDDSVFGVGSELAVRCGGVDQAVAWLEPFATKGRPFAAIALVGALLAAGRAEDALHWCREPGRRVDLFVLQTLTDLLTESGRADEALTWLISLAEQGNVFALWRMAGLSVEIGLTCEALNRAKDFVRKGHTSALHLTAFLTAQAGRGEEAISWYRKAILAGESFGIAEMVDLLEEMGRDDEAERMRRYGLEPSGQIASGFAG
ncbi:restriction endonuclease [Streptomyces sp. MK37H]|uniref:restriction endonuclease n=1 Tax=Streptomyces sp. MK37H TaxID=2699117 RepID=UPI001B380A88|nr:restriction endonuclease [Streptomyces sp. MK37H]MBP8534393.1 hypothetical protein [Streptomyces sp. MK37H]